MKKIEIQTTHNIPIQYEPAPLMSRILAYFLDIILISIYWFMASLAVAFMGFAGNPYISFFVLGLPYIFYDLFCEIFFEGQTIGKKALGIRVIKLNGKNLESMDLVQRWASRFIDITSTFGILASLFVSSTERKQRLGDMMAGTIVIKTSLSFNVSLDDLQKIQEQEYDEPVFARNYIFHDREMLALKNLLIRSRKYPGPENKELLKETAESFAKAMELEQVNDNPYEFLSALLKDYVKTNR